MSFFQNSIRAIGDYKEKSKINRGYPVTYTPYMPDSFTKTPNKFKIMKSVKGYPKVGFTLAPQGSDPMSSKSLEMIRKKLMTWLNGSDEFKEPLPDRLLAVSFAENNFQVGNSFYDFLPFPEFGVSTSAFFTYKRLTENLQLTFYNFNGMDFLAGYCYFIVPKGKPENLESDRASLYLAQMSAEPYPLQNRKNSVNFVMCKKYGRFCNKAGKRVVVDCSGKNDKLRPHYDYDHCSEQYYLTPCKECSQDSISYIWKEEHSSRISFSSPQQHSSPAPALTPTAPTAPPLTPSLPTTTTSAEDLLIFRILELSNIEIDGAFPFKTSITVFDRKTGEQMESSKCPVITELKEWMDRNKEFNVHPNSAITAHLVLGSEYGNRIGACVAKGVEMGEARPSTTPYRSSGNRTPDPEEQDLSQLYPRF